MSHGIRVMDIGWQAFQAGAALFEGYDLEHLNRQFTAWWLSREEQGCALPACVKCGYSPDAVVLASWSFTIPRDLPSLNERISNGARGWRYRRVRESWIADMKTMRIVHRIGTHGQAMNLHRKRVTLVRLYSGRMRQFDKANIDTKACVDAMVSAFLLRDDSPRWLELHVEQERGTERGTRVLIEELAHVA